MYFQHCCLKFGAADLLWKCLIDCFDQFIEILCLCTSKCTRMLLGCNQKKPGVDSINGVKCGMACICVFFFDDGEKKDINDFFQCSMLGFHSVH